jgi:hypothetical protein
MNRPHHKTTRHSYQIRFEGTVDQEFVAAFCPPETTLSYDGAITTLDHLVTDQSGILGLVRHLHNLGYTILSLNCQPEEYLS